MASTISFSFLHHVTLFLLLAQITHSAPIPRTKNHAEHSTYIVHADHLAKPQQFATHEDWYTSLVATHSPCAAANSSRLLHTYDTVMHGFAVRLTGDEARRMSNAAGVTGVHEDRELRFLTTRSPGFLGLDPGFGAWKDTDMGDGVIIGFVDSGIWPENPSFNDGGLGPVRASWRGGCVDAWDFNASMCNNKLVGAKAFGASTHGSPRDAIGHGSHVASTAAGSEVRDIGLNMFARGTARGVAPKARIAMYRAAPVMANVAKAIDAAVKDGVDIISMSIGDYEAHPFYNDTLSIATFGAARKGVFVVLAGGNDGAGASTVTNVAPWMTTVGAATVDRQFPGYLNLGDGTFVTGQSLYTIKSDGSTMVPLVASLCSRQALKPDRITGKIVVCAYQGGQLDIVMDVLREIHAAGLVLVTSSTWSGDGVLLPEFTLPGLLLDYTAGEKLGAYMASEPYPSASLSLACETVIGENRAPRVAVFSSRGPNPIVPELLKPDVVAPGVNILAAITSLFDTKVNYGFDSGTSMACPHVAGVAALIKKKHPNWSPAMIRSALMTTAARLDNIGRDILDNAITDGSSGATAATPFAAGAGHVRPQLAMDPGLVYDAGARDYFDFLCALDFTKEQLRLFAPDMATCTTTTLPGGAAGLNYPSFVVVFHDSGDVGSALTRTVTKVSEEAETYNVTVVAPRHVKVTVTPATLEFKKQYEKKTYTVQFTSDYAGGPEWEFGHIIWENEKHQVRSPVAFVWKN